MLKEEVFLIPFFQKLASTNIEYAVLRNYSGLPFSLKGSDLDIIVSKDDLNSFYDVFNEILKETNGVVVSRSKGLAPKISILGGNREGYYGIQFDIHHGVIPYKVAEIFPSKFIFSRLKYYKKIKVLDEDDAIFIAFLQKIFYNKKCEKYFIDAKKAWNQNKGIYTNAMQIKFSHNFVSMLDDVFLSNTYNAAKVKKLGTLGARELTKGLSQKIELFQLFMSKTYRFLNPLGYTIAFLGVDGVGKTTIIDGILPILTEAVHNEIHYEHMRPNLFPSIASILGKQKPPGIVSNPHKKDASGFFGSLFRLFYYSLDYIIGFWLKVYPSIVKKPSLWIFDRYFYDYLTDPKRGRIKLPKWIINFFKFFIPRPNLIICLGGNPETIYGRKKELPLNEVQNQIRILENFSKREQNSFWIDTTSRDIDSTINEVIVIIKKNMNLRLND